MLLKGNSSTHEKNWSDEEGVMEYWSNAITD
jgi:hypothetical protein